MFAVYHISDNPVLTSHHCEMSQEPALHRSLRSPALKGPFITMPDLGLLGFALSALTNLSGLLPYHTLFCSSFQDSSLRTLSLNTCYSCCLLSFHGAGAVSLLTSQFKHHLLRDFSLILVTLLSSGSLCNTDHIILIPVIFK